MADYKQMSKILIGQVRMLEALVETIQGSNEEAEPTIKFIENFMEMEKVKETEQLLLSKIFHNWKNLYWVNKVETTERYLGIVSDIRDNAEKKLAEEQFALKSLGMFDSCGVNTSEPNGFIISLIAEWNTTCWLHINRHWKGSKNKWQKDTHDWVKNYCESDHCIIDDLGYNITFALQRSGLQNMWNENYKYCEPAGIIVSRMKGLEYLSLGEFAQELYDYQDGDPDAVLETDDWEGVIVESDIDKIHEVFENCIFWEIKTTCNQEDRYIVCYNN